MVVDGEMSKDYTSKDCFVVLMGVEGKAVISMENGNTENLNQGETLLVPASASKIKIKSFGAKILEVSV